MKSTILFIVCSVALFCLGDVILHSTIVKGPARCSVTERENDNFPFVFDIRYDEQDSMYVAEFADGVIYSADTDSLNGFVQDCPLLDDRHSEELRKSTKAYYDHPIPKCVRNCR